MKKLIFISYSIFIQCAVSFSQEIRIMSWNVFMVPPVIFKSCQTERAFLISDYIKSINPDILVLEETFMTETRAVMYDNLKQIFPYQSNITKKGFMKANSGVWIFSKYPIGKQDFITYKKKRGSDIFARKGATFLELTINDKRVQIVGSHTQSLLKYRSTRTTQFNQLKSQIMDKYFQDSVPQFIIGDLNCNYYDSDEYCKMIELLDVNHAVFSGEKYSWNGLENDLANKFSEHTLELLDYIFLRNQQQQHAEIISTSILKPYSDSCICDKKFHNLSDHHPVMSTILLK